MTELITNTRMRAFQACQRLHQIRYVDGYTSTAERPETDFGTLVHVGQAAWWSAYQRIQIAEQEDLGIDSRSIDPLERAFQAMSTMGDESSRLKANTIMTAYDARWADEMQDLEVLAVEVEFRAPFGAACWAGKLDAIAQKRSDGSKWLIEHKTTGADLSSASTYWQRLRMDPQVSMYFAGARALGHELAGCIYDVIKRPDVRPLKATPVDKRQYTKQGRLYANQREADETPEEFRDRLTALIAENPEAWFQRAEVVRLPEELEAFQRDLDILGKATWLASPERHAPRNPDACFRYGHGRPCEFYDVCSGAASLDDDTRFRKLDNLHPELDPKEGDQHDDGEIERW